MNEWLLKRKKKYHVVLSLFIISLTCWVIFVSVLFINILNVSNNKKNKTLVSDSNISLLKDGYKYDVIRIRNNTSNDYIYLNNVIYVNNKKYNVKYYGDEEKGLAIDNAKYVYITENINFSRHTFIDVTQEFEKIVYLDYKDYEVFKENNENNVVGFGTYKYKDINIIGYKDSEEVEECSVNFFKYANVVYLSDYNNDYNIYNDPYYIDYYDNECIKQRIESPEKEGYKFIGWYKDKTLTDEWDFDNDVVNTFIKNSEDEEYIKIHKVMHLYAKWEKINE